MQKLLNISPKLLTVYLSELLILLGILVMFGLFVPHAYAANYYNINCSDVVLHGSATCSGGVIDIVSSGDYVEISPSLGWFYDSQTYYMTFVQAGSGGARYDIAGQTNGNGSIVSNNYTATDYPQTTPSDFGSPLSGIYVEGDSSFTGTISGFCVTDTSGGCVVSPPSTPTFSPTAGTYSSTQSVTISSTGSTAIYYTLDGSTPTTGSTLYSGAISVSSSETVKAIGHNSGGNSSVGSAAYTISGGGGGGGGGSPLLSGMSLYNPFPNVAATDFTTQGSGGYVVGFVATTTSISSLSLFVHETGLFDIATSTMFFGIFNVAFSNGGGIGSELCSGTGALPYTPQIGDTAVYISLGSKCTGLTIGDSYVAYFQLPSSTDYVWGTVATTSVQGFGYFNGLMRNNPSTLVGAPAICLGNSFCNMGGNVPLQTQITSVSPAPDSTVASSTAQTISISGYVAPSDYSSGETVQVSLASINGGLSALPDLAQWQTAGAINLSIPITSSGNFSVSTVVTSATPLVGVYVAQAYIEQPTGSLLGYTYASNNLAPVDWQFTFATSTAAEKAYAVSILAGLSVNNAAIASTSIAVTDSGSTCVIGGSFSLLQCSNYIFFQVDQGGLYGAVMGVVNRPPLGYAIRAVGLLDGSIVGSSTPGISADLPALTVDLKQTGLGAASGVNSLNLTPWNLLMGSSSMLGTATDYQGQTFRQIVEPGWDFLVAFLYGIGMVLQLLGVRWGSGVENEVRNTRRMAR